MIAVADTSPIIALQRAGLLHLLPALFDEPVLIPPAVRDELEEGGRMRAADVSWLQVMSPTSTPPMLARLHAGEREAIALAASQPDCLLLMDERDGRRVADGLGITVLGTGGLLVEAKRVGLLTAVAPVLDELIATGFRVDANTRAELLRLANEKP